MWKRWRTVILVVTASAVAMFALYLCFEFYYEDYEKIISSIIYTEVCAPSYNHWLTHVRFCTGPPLVWLSVQFPSVPVYGIWNVLLNLLWLSALLWLWIHKHSGMLRNSVFWIFSLSLFVLVFADSLVFVNLTRQSVLLCAAALLMYHDRRQQRSVKIASLLIFSVGVITRLVMPALVLAFLIGYFMLNGEKLKEVIRRYYPHILVLLIVSGVYYADRATTHHYGKIYESKYEYSVDKKYFVPISEMHTRLDTIKYYTATNLLCLDTAVVNEKLMSKLIVSTNPFSFLVQPAEWIIFFQKMEMFYTSSFYVILSLLTTVLLTVVFLRRKAKSYLVKVFVLCVVSGVLIIAPSVAVDLFERYYSPMLAIAGLLIAGFTLHELSRNENRKIFLLISVALFVFSCAHLRELKNKTIKEEEYAQSHQLVLRELAGLQKSNTLFFFDFPEFLFNNKVLHRDSDSTLQRANFLNLFFFTYWDFGQSRIIERFGFSPLDYPGMYNYFTANSRDIIIIARRERIGFMTTYFKYIYGINLRFNQAGIIVGEREGFRVIN